MPAPTGVVSPPLPTTAAVPTCGTKIRLRLESAATECELEDCGTFSINVLVPASITPSTAPPCGQPAASPQSRLDPVYDRLSPELYQTSSEPVMWLTGVCTKLTAFINSVMVSLGLFCGVQPSRIFSFGPTVAPFGPQPCSAITPVLVVVLNAPSVTMLVVIWAG